MHHFALRIPLACAQIGRPASPFEGVVEFQRVRPAGRALASACWIARDFLRP